jgi:hypothetical protein
MNSGSLTGSLRISLRALYALFNSLGFAIQQLEEVIGEDAVGFVLHLVRALFRMAGVEKNHEFVCLQVIQKAEKVFVFESGRSKSPPLPWNQIIEAIFGPPVPGKIDDYQRTTAWLRLLAALSEPIKSVSDVREVGTSINEQFEVVVVSESLVFQELGETLGIVGRVV